MLLCLALFLSIQIFAQQESGKVTGLITSEAGTLLPGVTITNINTGKSIASASDGTYSIPADNNDKLQFSHTGYVDFEVTVGDQQTINVKLTAESTNMEGVLVIGYGKKSKQDVTGAVTQLDSKNFRQGTNVSADNLLQGKMAGVRIVPSSGEPGAGMNVSIRGLGSIRSGSTPLFVVDGVPLSNESVSANGPDFGLGSTQAKNPLNFLNTNDIASISVLKDASAAAIYGARGSNGVVIITTKQGKKGVPTFSYDGYVAFSSVVKKIDLLSADQYRSAVTNKAYDHGSSTDWQDVIYRNAISQNHALSFSTATSSGNYYASISNMNQQGIVETSDLKRTSARINAEESFFDNKRLKINMNVTASQIKERGIPNGNTAGSDGQVIIHALMANPTRSVFDEDGNYTNFNMNAHYNPAYLLHIYNDKTSTLRVLGNVQATLRILNGLEYKFNYGIDKSTSERNSTIYPNVTDRTPLGAYVQNNLEATSSLLEHYLTYDKNIGLHGFNLLGGFSYQKFNFSGTSFGTRDIAQQGSGVDPEYNPGYSGTPTTPNGYAQENELQSFFGRLDYNYDKKYLFTASLRADGSTRFGENNKYGYFPSFALGWVISKEKFMSTSDVISDLKLRASWGQTGNQEVQNKITQASYSLSASGGYFLYDDHTIVNGIVVNRTANPNLKWEVVSQNNIGVDFELWKGKLYGTLDYFNKTTTDPILNIPSEPLSPTNYVWKNVPGKIINNGVELSLGSQLINKNNFNWSVDGNATFLHNTVKDLPVSELFSGSVSGPGLSGVNANIYKNGYEIGSFYMLKHLGFDPDGKDIFEDYNKDGSITPSDRQIFEGALPNLTYGFNSQMNYKAISFSFSLLGQAGGYLVNNTNLDLSINNLASDRNTLVKYLESGASTANQPQLSTLYLEKSDFLRLNNIQLSYAFPVTKLKYVKGISIYVSAQNLFTITPYSGYDPLVNTQKNVDGNQSIGIDYTTYPSAKTFMIGASLNFN